jgi:hypothetical protein
MTNTACRLKKLEHHLLPRKSERDVFLVTFGGMTQAEEERNFEQALDEFERQHGFRPNSGDVILHVISAVPRSDTG